MQREGSTVAFQDSPPAKSSHKLQKIFPQVVDDVSLLYGFYCNDLWVDGIFTAAWRKAIKVRIRVFCTPR